MKKPLTLLVFTLIAIASMLVNQHKAHAAFNANLLIDDVVFNDTGSMNATQIDNWLNANFSNSCISPNSGFQSKIPNGYSPSGGFTYGAFGTAGQVVSAAAQAYGLNPEVLLVTLQKEQSLVAGGVGFCNNGDENKYSAAVGYGCPDGGAVYSWSGISLYMRNGVEHTATGSTCVNSSIKAGFSQQIIRAAWLLKFGQQRSLGNINWAVIGGSWDNSDDLATCYGGPMTQGTFKRCHSDTATYYDGYATIDSSATHMDTGATAALYWYTPHFHGNQNFVSLFEGWFGSTISALYYSCHNSTNISGALSGRRVVADRISGNADNLAMTFLNNTGSSCIEIHTWGQNQQGWIRNLATNHPAVNPADDVLITADTNGDGKDELILVKLRGSQSGNIEIHTWDSSDQHWASNIATNHPAVDPADDGVLSADTVGDGRDRLVLVKYWNSQSGRVEVHTWNPGYQSWMSNIATNHPSINW